MVVTSPAPTSHTPPQAHDQRRNFRNKTPGHETRLIGLRTHSLRTSMHEIDRLAKVLCNKPGVVARLEHTLSTCNEAIRVELESARKFANRKDHQQAASIVRGSDSAEFRSIEQGGNG